VTTTWVALLRGINVGKAKRVAMADLRALLEGLGYHDVRTVLQSGNALFTTPKGAAASFEKAIGKQIANDLGLDVKVLVRSAAQLAQVIEGNPFVAQGIAVGELHATFLSKAPAASKLAAVDPDDVAPDEFALGDRVLYTRLPNGVMASKLPSWDTTLGLDASARSWKTVLRLGQAANSA
jgi:uncharacterized protein (DUF1697 family)